MDLDLVRPKQPDFQHKTNKNDEIKTFITLTLISDLHMLPPSPRPGVASFSKSLMLLHETTSPTPQTSRLQPQPYDTKADKIHQEIFINFLE